jgi:hypothetical protein
MFKNKHTKLKIRMACSATTFFRAIFKSRHKRIWNQHKILRFLILRYFWGKLWGHISTLSWFWIKKKMYILKHFASCLYFSVFLCVVGRVTDRRGGGVG